jgi:hypothetical protein
LHLTRLLIHFVDLSRPKVKESKQALLLVPSRITGGGQHATQVTREPRLKKTQFIVLRVWATEDSLLASVNFCIYLEQFN